MSRIFTAEAQSTQRKTAKRIIGLCVLCVFAVNFPSALRMLPTLPGYLALCFYASFNAVALHGVFVALSKMVITCYAILTLPPEPMARSIGRMQRTFPKLMENDMKHRVTRWASLLAFALFSLYAGYTLAWTTAVYPDALKQETIEGVLEKELKLSKIKPKDVEKSENYPKFNDEFRKLRELMANCQNAFGKIDWNQFDASTVIPNKIAKRGEAITPQHYKQFDKYTLDYLNANVLPVSNLALDISRQVDKVEAVLNKLVTEKVFKKTKAVQKLSELKQAAVSFSEKLLNQDDEIRAESVKALKEKQADTMQKAKEMSLGALATAVDKCKQFIVIAKQNPTPTIINDGTYGDQKKVPRAMSALNRDITQPLGNVIKFKLWDELGKKDPTAVYEPFKKWTADSSGKNIIKGDADEQEVKQLITEFENAVKGVENWMK